MLRKCLGCMEEFDNKYRVCPFCGYIVGTQPEEAIHIRPGSLLHNRYIVGKVLGYGGFGVTYIGWDGRLEQKVAIKEYLPSDFSTRMPGQSQVTVFNGEKSEQFYDGLRKFVEEAKRLAKFQNEPGIVKIFDSFEENDTAYIVMEYLDGETLTKYLERVGTIPADEAVEMLLPVMKSLEVVHSEGILHRDIAPDNIFLTKDGEVKLIDFGASRYATTSHSKSLTVIIKQGYSPEEQYRSRGDQGPHTDVYALSATLYKMITGVMPPDAMERRAYFENKKKDILIKPHKLSKDLSLVYENAILNALNVRIEDRTSTIREFADELTADKPAKRRSGKIAPIGIIYMWPMWLKIMLPVVFVCILVFAALMGTGVIEFKTVFNEKIQLEGFVPVPEVEGLYYLQAKEELEKAGLKPGVSKEGTVKAEYIDAGIILYQNPMAGTYFEEGSDVILTISGGGKVAKPVNGIATVPFVKFDTQEEAIKKIISAGLHKPKIEDSASDDFPKGTVIEQSIDAGTEIETKYKNKKKNIIILTVSSGPSAFEMPDVIGQNKEIAKEFLEEEHNLKVNLVPEHNDKFKPDEIIGQSIDAGETVERGSEVTLYYAVEKTEELIIVKNVVGKTLNEAKQILENQGFTVAVGEEFSDSIAGIVTKQSPKDGESHQKGGKINIIISKGPKPDVTISTEETTTEPTTIATTTTESTTTVPPSTEPPTVKPIETIKKYYTVTLNVVGGELSRDKREISIGFGDVYGNLPIPIKDGYKFEGWHTDINAGTLISPSMKYNITENQQLYAHWSQMNYMVYLDAKGGSISSSQVVVTFNSTYPLLPTPKKDGYRFNGWFTSSGMQVYGLATKVEISSDHTLYAKWDQNAISDWVIESEVPDGACIVDTKWKYNLRKYETSNQASLEGWKLYEEKKNESELSNWSKTKPEEKPGRIIEEKLVDETAIKTTYWYKRYKYYHKAKKVWGYTYAQNWADNQKYDGEWEYKSTNSELPKAELYDGKYQGYGGTGSNTWFRADVHKSQGTKHTIYKVTETVVTGTHKEYRYQDIIYTYYFYKDVPMESATDPSGQSNVYDVMKLVRYISK